MPHDAIPDQTCIAREHHSRHQYLSGWLAVCLSVRPSVRPQARQGNPETQQLNSQPHDNISPWGIRQCWPVIHFSDHLFT